MNVIMLSVAALYSFSAFAGQCPVLAGSYHCTFSEAGQDVDSILKIDQKLISTTGQPEAVQYSFDYTDVEGSPDVIRASLQGEIDSYGWNTRCEAGKLISTSDEEMAVSEIYLKRANDHSLTFIRTLNGNLVSSCPQI